MKSAVLKALIKSLIPAGAGALGAWLLTAYPAVHVAFCTAKF